MLSPLLLLASLSLGGPAASPVDTFPEFRLPQREDTLAAALLLRPSPSSVSLRAPALSGALVSRGPASSEPSGGTDDVLGEGQLVEYSDAYFTRLNIHRWASYLTLPLFVGQYVVGQKLIKGEGSPGLRRAHNALAGGLGALFAVNTVTGGLNALEARKDPVEKNRRTLHSVLMLMADAGFVATALLVEEGERDDGTSRNLNSHRAVAIGSMGISLLSYAIMLPPFRRD